MLRFISFGSGSSGNCYLIYTENDALIIDAGVGIRMLKKHMRDYGLSLSQVHRILITHDHADHIKSVGSLSHDCHLPVYATKAVHHGIDGNYCVAKKVEAGNRHYIEAGVTPFAVPHDSSDNVGYMLEAEGTNICLITDAGRVTEEMGLYIGKARNLIIESNHDLEMLQQGPYPEYLKRRIVSGTGHLSNVLCGEAIARYAGEHLQHVWLCHLSEENNHPELALKTVETVLRSYGMVAGKDFGLEVLKRIMPTGMFELH